MELKINTKPNPFKVFDKVSKLKKLIKPIKVQNNSEFIEKLLLKPDEMLAIIGEGFSLHDHNYIDINCELKCDIPISFYAHLGHGGANCWVNGEKPNGESIDDPFGDTRSNLIEALESFDLPSKIVFTEIELSQVIGNSTSVFKYKLNP